MQDNERIKNGLEHLAKSQQGIAAIRTIIAEASIPGKHFITLLNAINYLDHLTNIIANEKKNLEREANDAKESTESCEEKHECRCSKETGVCSDPSGCDNCDKS